MPQKSSKPKGLPYQSKTANLTPRKHNEHIEHRPVKEKQPLMVAEMSYQASLKSLKSKVSVAEAGVDEETASRKDIKDGANQEIMDFIFNFNRPDKISTENVEMDKLESPEASPPVQAVKAVKKGAKHAIKSGMKA